MTPFLNLLDVRILSFLHLVVICCLASTSGVAGLPQAPKPPSVADKVAASSVVFIGTIQGLRYRFGVGPLIGFPGEKAGWDAVADVMVDEVLFNRGPTEVRRVYASIQNNQRLSPERLERVLVGERFIFFGAFQPYRSSGEEGAYHLSIPGWWLSPEGMQSLDKVKDSIRALPKSK
jgi:hypothetical protein